MASRRILHSANVVSAMPAIGKTYLATKFPTLFRDLESSDYHWLKDPETDEILFNENGDKIEHPEWPNNYIDAIKNLNQSGMYRVIFVSAHELVRQKMKEQNIKYATMFGSDTNTCKTMLISRCITRHSSPKFIEDYRENYSTYVKSMRNDPNAVVRIEVDAKALEMGEDWLLRVFLQE